MSDTETVEIKNRFTGDVMFTAQVEAGLSKDRKLGAAVRLAVKAGADLADANLAGANLAGANLSGADLDRMVEWIDVIIATAEAEQTQFRMAAAMTALQAVAVVVRAESDRLLGVVS